MREPSTGPVDDDDPCQAGTEPIWAVLARARDGDRDAFATLYDRYLDLVHRYLYWRLGGDTALVEDLTSETFTRALRAIGSFTWMGRDPGGWFLAIARHLMLDHVKSARTRLDTPAADVRDDAGRTISYLEDDVIGADVVARLLALVTDEQRTCLILRVLMDLSVVDTATLMGKSTGAVKALYHRAIRRLAAEFAVGGVR